MEFLWNGLLSITWQPGRNVCGRLIADLPGDREGLRAGPSFTHGLWRDPGEHPFSGALNQMMEGVGETHGIVQWLFEDRHRSL